MAKLANIQKQGLEAQLHTMKQQFASLGVGNIIPEKDSQVRICIAWHDVKLLAGATKRRILSD